MKDVPKKRRNNKVIVFFSLCWHPFLINVPHVCSRVWDASQRNVHHRKMSAHIFTETNWTLSPKISAGMTFSFQLHAKGQILRGLNPDRKEGKKKEKKNLNMNNALVCCSYCQSRSVGNLPVMISVGQKCVPPVNVTPSSSSCIFTSYKVSNNGSMKKDTRPCTYMHIQTRTPTWTQRLDLFVPLMSQEWRGLRQSLC